jgi:hypothetical protein
VKLNNNAELTQIALPFDQSEKKYQVIEREGRHLVVTRLAHSGDYAVVDDCRTERFAQARCDALNGGAVPTPPKLVTKRYFEGERE